MSLSVINSKMNELKENINNLSSKVSYIEKLNDEIDIKLGLIDIIQQAKSSIDKIDKNNKLLQKELVQRHELIKSKWEITIDVMMIIGKYFKSNNDYINIMKVNKKYHDLVEMYHFNPISDYELFINMETQYLYYENDIKKERRNVSIYLLV